MQEDALDTLFSIDLKYILSDCIRLLLHSCSKTHPAATEEGKGMFPYSPNHSLSSEESRNLNRSRGRKDERKPFSGVLWLVQRPVLYNLGPVAQLALPTVVWVLLNKPIIKTMLHQTCLQVYLMEVALLS